jgi:hypothetical protein
MPAILAYPSYVPKYEQWPEHVIEGVADVLGETNDGLTGAEIGRLLEQRLLPWMARWPGRPIANGASLRPGGVVRAGDRAYHCGEQESFGLASSRSSSLRRRAAAALRQRSRVEAR